MSNYTKIPIGKNFPNDLYAIIEISAQSTPIKYEKNQKYDLLMVDRFIPTSIFYPCNYGYINQTLSLDNDTLDILIITTYPLNSNVIIRCRPIGVLNMEDEKGKDEKIIAVPHSSLTKEYQNIQDISHLSEFFKKKIIHFFTTYKNLEKNKWTKKIKLENLQKAHSIIISAHTRYQKKNKKI
ncbi:inorganic diphosphatase [Buchnera aphidicola]|uniref:inorganic diphosphatase n=1 Tax=Buchnera aphidicola TaxID=9 RepID=UPI0031B6B84E